MISSGQMRKETDEQTDYEPIIDERERAIHDLGEKRGK